MVRSPFGSTNASTSSSPMCQEYELLFQQQFTCNFCCSIYSESLDPQKRRKIEGMGPALPTIQIVCSCLEVS